MGIRRARRVEAIRRPLGDDAFLARLKTLTRRPSGPASADRIWRRVTATSYTATGKVATVTDPNGNVTRNTYDANDRLATATDALGQVTRFTYDPLGRLAATYNDAVQAEPLAATTYTANGLAATFTDAAGHVTEYEYDGLDRLAELTLAAGTGLASSETYAYDAAGNRTGRVTRAGDTIAYAYDALNRLVTKTPPSPAPVVTYAYDLAGRMTGASDTSAAIEPADSPLGATNAEYETSYSYDAVNRPLEIVWDPAPVPAAPSAASVTFGHSYDALNRRTAQTVTDTDWWYLPPSSASTTAYTANALDQYTVVGGATPDYDDNGNLTGDGTFAYTYDAENRLVEFADGGGTVAEYAYDARGRRKSLTVGSDIVISVTDAEDRVVLEYDGTTGDLLRWNVHGPGLDDTLAVMDLDADTRETLVPDIQGSILATLASATGALTKLGYLPFGENPTLTAGGTRYTGRLLDAATAGSAAQPSGLYYYRARMYSPTLGRFLQPDPIGMAGGPNLYTYASNDPLDRLDPLGQCDSPTGCSSSQPKTTQVAAVGSQRRITSNFLSVADRSETSPPQFVPDNQLPINSRLILQHRELLPDGSVAVFIPRGYVPEPARNGAGFVFRAPGTTGDRNTIRLMAPNDRNPTMYFRVYNNDGQPISIYNGRPLTDAETHFEFRGFLVE